MHAYMSVRVKETRFKTKGQNKNLIKQLHASVAATVRILIQVAVKHSVSVSPA